MDYPAHCIMADTIGAIGALDALPTDLRPTTHDNRAIFMTSMFVSILSRPHLPTANPPTDRGQQISHSLKEVATLCHERLVESKRIPLKGEVSDRS